MSNSWTSKGLQTFSKKKQKLFIKFLENETYQNEKRYRDYKSLFGLLKEKSKKKIYHKQRLIDTLKSFNVDSANVAENTKVFTISA